MTPQPPTTVRGTLIVGRFTYEGKPLRSSRVELRSPNGRLLATAATDKNGVYKFPVRNAGRYQVRMLNPSVEGFEVDYLPDRKQQRFDVNYYADYCYVIKVTS